jgi:hypothetical protein
LTGRGTIVSSDYDPIATTPGYPVDEPTVIYTDGDNQPIICCARAYRNITAKMLTSEPIPIFDTVYREVGVSLRRLVPDLHELPPAQRIVVCCYHVWVGMFNRTADSMTYEEVHSVAAEVPINPEGSA